MDESEWIWGLNKTIILIALVGYHGIMVNHSVKRIYSFWLAQSVLYKQGNFWRLIGHIHKS